MVLRDENPLVVVATNVALAALLVVGLSALPWAEDLWAALWPVGCVAVAGVNVVSVRLLAAGVRPGRLFLFPSIAGHICWAVAAVALALPQLSWGASPFEGHATAAALRWSAITLAAIGGLCQQRASTAPSLTTTLRCLVAGVGDHRDRWGVARKRQRDGFTAGSPRLTGVAVRKLAVRHRSSQREAEQA